MHRPHKNHRRKPRYGGAKPAGGRRSVRKSKARSLEGGPIRLQKALADAGVGSRRQCEEVILEGRVEIDGQVAAELGTRVDPSQQEIRVDGEVLRRPKRVYYLINKPLGVVSTSRDPAGRMRVIDFAPGQHRLFTVGRLDQTSEGLILVTNDGPLTDLLTHPRYGVKKTYLAEVAGAPTPAALDKLRRGVHLAEGFAHAKRIIVRRSHKQSTLLEIVLDEGRNREVRRLLAKIGHKVMKLRRIAMGPLRLGNLKPGESRPLTVAEVEELYHAAREGRKAEPPRLPKSKSSKPATDEQTLQPAPIIDQSIDDVDAFEEDLRLEDVLPPENQWRPEDGLGRVDLSPIRPRSAKPAQGTVIGGERRTASDRAAKPRGRKPARRRGAKKRGKRR